MRHLHIGVDAIIVILVAYLLFILQVTNSAYFTKVGAIPALLLGVVRNGVLFVTVGIGVKKHGVAVP